MARQKTTAGRRIADRRWLETVQAIATGRLTRLFPDWRGEHIPFNAILPSNRFIPQRTRAFVTHLQQCFRTLNDVAN